jgi:hypothetical protein
MKTSNLSSSETAKIEEEIRYAVQTVIQGCEALDMEKAFHLFLDLPDFLMIASDGSLCDYQTYIENNINYLSTCSSFKLTTIRQEVKVLDRDLALCSWIYKADAALNTGEHDLFEKAGATFVFNRIDGEWKVIHYHESALPPVRLTA